MMLEVRVKPNSKRESIKLENGVLIVKIREKPVEGRANRAVVEKLAKKLKIAKSCIEIVGGERARNKRISIECLDKDRVLELLKEE